MLEPQERRQLLACLRPPPGYTLNAAVGTTYSLDLMALLTAPLAFTFFDWEDESGRPTANAHALLAAIRRNAERMALFCHSSRIAIPAGQQLLYSYLEESVFEALPPDPQGSFHPKVWVLRFTANEEPTRYRFICLSRNLTFDRSWDTALILDGELEDRAHAFPRNRPLSEFLVALPKLALRPVPARVKDMLRLMRREILKVNFELPENFESYRFWPIGLDDRKSWPFDCRTDRLLVISPFLTPTRLAQLSRKGKDNILISRLESLDALAPACLAGFKQVFSLSPDADAEPDPEEAEATEPQAPLLGLHAKLYVVDQGWKSALFTGSANATDSAFSRNIEFLTELGGKKGVVGIEALLRKEKGRLKLPDLLQEFTPGVRTEIDEKQEQLLRAADKAATDLARGKLEARVGTTATEGEYQIQLFAPDPATLHIPSSITIRCWPISLSETHSVSCSLLASAVAEFNQISIAAITSFFAFHVEATSAGASASRRFVLNIPLVNAPEARKDAVLRSLIQDREAVLKLLLMLLFGDATGGEGDGDPITGMVRGNGPRGLPTPLFESLMRALDRSPDRVEDVSRLIEDIRRSPDGSRLLPEGFDSIWPAIAAVRAQYGK